jgi:hypothetical protein
MNKSYLLASIAYLPDPSPGGIMATAMRYLANAAPTATGMTMIEPGGSMRYISCAEAERFAFGPEAGEVQQ